MQYQVLLFQMITLQGVGHVARFSGRCWLLAFMLLGSITCAQSIKVGMILSQSGVYGEKGQEQAMSVALRAQVLQDQGWHNLTIHYDLHDDQSDPHKAYALAQEMIAQGVDVMICCSSRPIADMLSPLLEAAEIPTISLALGGLSDEAWLDKQPRWLFSLAAPQESLVKRILLDMQHLGLSTLVMLTSETYALMAERVLASEAARYGVDRLEVISFPEDSDVLTPEALYTAIQSPHAVIVWSGERSTTLAVEALRSRGYQGAIYIRPDTHNFKDSGALAKTFVPIGSFTLPAAPLGDEILQTPNTNKLQQYQQHYLKVFGKAPSDSGARAWDAVTLIQQAVRYNQSIGHQLQVGQSRQLMRDGLVNMHNIMGVSGVLDFSPDNHYAVNLNSFAIMGVEGQGLQPLR